MAAEDPDETEPRRWQRWWRSLVAAGRWALDVFRGHAWSRHLDNREE